MEKMKDKKEQEKKRKPLGKKVKTILTLVLLGAVLLSIWVARGIYRLVLKGQTTVTQPETEVVETEGNVGDAVTDPGQGETEEKDPAAPSTPTEAEAEVKALSDIFRSTMEDGGFTVTDETASYGERGETDPFLSAVSEDRKRTVIFIGLPNPLTSGTRFSDLAGKLSASVGPETEIRTGTSEMTGISYAMRYEGNFCLIGSGKSVGEAEENLLAAGIPALPEDEDKTVEEGQ